MKPEDQITEQVRTLHREGSAALVAASRVALRGGPTPTDAPVAVHEVPTEDLFGAHSQEIFGADLVLTTEDRQAQEIIAVQRGGTRGLKAATAHLGMTVVAQRRPVGPDPDGLAWWHTVRAQQMDPDGFALAEEAMQWHARCTQHGCWDLPHEGDHSKPQLIRVALPQAPVFLFCDWHGATSTAATVLVVLGGRGKGGPGQPALNFYKANPAWWGPNLDRFILTPHAVYLERLAGFLTDDTTPTDRALVGQLATVMWLDTDLGAERHAWSLTAAHDLVHPVALDGQNPRSGPPLHRPLAPCACGTCQRRRAAATG